MTDPQPPSSTPTSAFTPISQRRSNAATSGASLLRPSAGSLPVPNDSTLAVVDAKSELAATDAGSVLLLQQNKRQKRDHAASSSSTVNTATHSSSPLPAVVSTHTTSSTDLHQQATSTERNSIGIQTELASRPCSQWNQQVTVEASVLPPSDLTRSTTERHAVASEPTLTEQLSEAQALNGITRAALPRPVAPSVVSTASAVVTHASPPPQPSLDHTFDRDALNCVVCLDQSLGEVFQCQNGHLLCRTCFRKIVDSDQSKCAVCRVALDRDAPNRCRIAEMVIANLYVTCTNTGCSQRIKNNELSNHVREQCPHRPATCLWYLVGCDWLGTASQQRLHSRQCTFRDRPARKCIRQIEQRIKALQDQHLAFKQLADSQLHTCRMLSKRCRDLTVRDVIIERETAYEPPVMVSKVFKAIGLSWEVYMAAPTPLLTPANATATEDQMQYDTSSVRINLKVVGSLSRKTTVEVFILAGPSLSEYAIPPTLRHIVFRKRVLQSEQFTLPFTAEQAAMIHRIDNVNLRIGFLDVSAGRVRSSFTTINRTNGDSDGSGSDDDDTNQPDEESFRVPRRSRSRVYSPYASPRYGQHFTNEEMEEALDSMLQDAEHDDQHSQASSNDDDEQHQYDEQYDDSSDAEGDDQSIELHSHHSDIEHEPEAEHDSDAGDDDSDVELCEDDDIDSQVDSQDDVSQEDVTDDGDDIELISVDDDSSVDQHEPVHGRRSSLPHYMLASQHRNRAGPAAPVSAVEYVQDEDTSAPSPIQLSTRTEQQADTSDEDDEAGINPVHQPD